jgi:hypothetical protein
VSRNSAELLQEMLTPIKGSADRTGLHETFVTDLADQCYRCGDETDKSVILPCRYSPGNEAARGSGGGGVAFMFACCVLSAASCDLRARRGE